MARESAWAVGPQWRKGEEVGWLVGAIERNEFAKTELFQDFDRAVTWGEANKIAVDLP